MLINNLYIYMSFTNNESNNIIFTLDYNIITYSNEIIGAYKLNKLKNLNINKIQNQDNVDYYYSFIVEIFNYCQSSDSQNNIIKNYKLSFYEDLISFIIDNLCKYIPQDKYPKTIYFLISFYELYNEKIKIILTLYKWYLIYKNKTFWNKDTNSQIEELLFLKHYIQSLFDTSYGGVSFGIKLYQILESNNKEDTIDSAIERLSLKYIFLY